MLKHRIRSLLLKIRGHKSLNAYTKQGLVIGKNCSILHNVTFDFNHSWHIKIGNNVTIAPGVRILAHDASMKKHLDYTRIGKVIIKDNVFIGAGSIILPCVTIGENSIVGSGSVVTKDVPDNVVVTGNPARRIYSLDKFLTKCKKEMKEVPVFGFEYTVSGNVNNRMKKEMNDKMKKGFGFVV